LSLRRGLMLGSKEQQRIPLPRIPACLREGIPF
jgi:hypothetical protein